MSEASKPDEVDAVDDEVVAALARLRADIDAVDREILAALNRRARLVREVGRVKQGGRRSPVYVASRERDLVAALVAANPGPFRAGSGAAAVSRRDSGGSSRSFAGSG